MTVIRMRILIVNPFGIGDVLFTTPLISNLKEAEPDSYIGFVSNARTKDLLLNNPKIDKVFIYEKDSLRRLWRSSKILAIRKLMKLLNAIRKKRFDIAFDLSLGEEYGFFLWLAGIKKRVGYDYKNRGIFLTHKTDLSGYEKKHVVEYYLDLLRFIGIEPKPRALEFPLGEEEKRWADEFLAEHNVTDQERLVGIIPGGGTSWGAAAYKKQWPQHKFANLANQLIAKHRPRIILFGDMNEIPICSQVASLIKESPIMACGTTSLSKLAALMGRCAVVICNDGGPLHIAVSQGVKNISIFGPVDPLVYGPYPDDEDSLVIRKELVCQPCYRRFKLKECRHMECLTTIEVKEVMAAMDKFLGGEIGGA